MRHLHVDRGDDRLARPAGLHRRRHDPDGLRVRLHDLPAVETRPIISPIIGLVATLAPTIGPTVGGYLTDLFSWHWLFLVNIVPGIFVTVSTYLLVDFDEPDFSLFKTFDWSGLAFMAVFLGSLEFVLEEGPDQRLVRGSRRFSS